jgi:hypothetical protein
VSQTNHNGCGDGDREHARERSGVSAQEPAGRRAEGQHVGTGSNAGEAVGDAELIGVHPTAAAEFALEGGNGGIAAAEGGVADAEEEPGDCAQAGTLHRVYCSKAV